MDSVLKPMTTTQQLTVSINPLDRQKKPAKVDGAAVFTSSDESVATVTGNDDGLSALVVARGVGNYSISVSADADLGEGVVTIVGTATGTVTQGEAVSIDVVSGEPEEQP
jgi:hypothetical protein